DLAERLASTRSDVQRAEPGVDLVGPLLAHLLERHALPGAELHLSEARLLSQGRAETLGDDLGRLAGAAYRRGDHGVDRFADRSQPLRDLAHLGTSLVREPRVAAGKAPGETLARGQLRGTVPDQHERGDRSSRWRPAARRRDLLLHRVLCPGALGLLGRRVR